MSYSKGMTPTGAYKPPTAEKKLEKQVAALRKNMFQLSTTPGPYEVRKDERIGDYMVIVNGMAGYGVVNHLILHRLIGTDHGIDKEKAWVLSKASDVPGFLQNQDFPGEKKAFARFNEIRTQVAVQKGKIKIDSFGTETYPDGTNRKDVLDIAREASAQHAKVAGGNHFGDWTLYLSSKIAKMEYEVQALYTVNPEYTVLIAEPVFNMVGYQTTLDDGTPQKEVPYLYGKSVTEVGKAFYKVMMGEFPTPHSEKPKFWSSAFPTKVYGAYDPGNVDVMRIGLIKELGVHDTALKAVNKCRADIRATKVQSDKKALQADLEDLESELHQSELKIHAIEQQGTRPTVQVRKAFTGAIPSNTTVKEARSERAYLIDSTNRYLSEKAMANTLPLPPRASAAKVPAGASK
jgi:hypothetical protein